MVLRALGLGDFLTAVPALRGIRRGLPEHRITLAAPAALRPLAQLAGATDTVLPTVGLQRLSWSGPPPPVAVNLHGSGPQSHRVLEALRPGSLLAYPSTGTASDGVVGAAGVPAWDAEEHEVDRWCRLVASAGWPAEPTDLRLAAPPVASRAPGAVVVHAGAAYGSRRWPADRFAAVARHLADHGLRVVLTGSAAERPLAQAIAAASGLPADSVLAGETDLLQLAALVAAARLVVCGDTGVAHLATAYARPSVLLFGPTPPSRWGPRVEGPHTVLWHGSRGADPFAPDPDPALLQIRVEEVRAAVCRRLGTSVEWST